MRKKQSTGLVFCALLGLTHPVLFRSFVRRYADQFFHINGDGSEDSGDEHALYTLPHLPDAAACRHASAVPS